MIFIKRNCLDGIKELFKISCQNRCKVKDLSLLLFVIPFFSTKKALAQPNLLQTLNFAPTTTPTLHLGQVYRIERKMQASVAKNFFAAHARTQTTSAHM